MCTLVSQPRINQLHQWLTSQLSGDAYLLEPASNDASFRRYFRLSSADRIEIVMDAPPQQENTEIFARVCGLLAQADVRVPAIYAFDHQQGFMRLEDFGNESVFQRLLQAPQQADHIYRTALNELLGMQVRLNAQEVGLPRYDAMLLDREWGIFEQWFVEALLHTQIARSISEPLRMLLKDNMLQQPQVAVHRDYHSRNLMCLQDGNIGVIDFQDAVIGPVTYDVVSLLRDCYIDWPNPQIEVWLQDYFRRLTQAGLLDVDWAQFQRWFDLTGLQRHLKAVGIFARLYLRDGKPGYLPDIPRTLTYVAQVCQRYQELQPLSLFLQQQTIPEWK
jgi:N-acetylmuramate 1-kinase